MNTSEKEVDSFTIGFFMHFEEPNCFILIRCLRICLTSTNKPKHMRYILLFLLIPFSLGILDAQKILQLEKVRSFKNKRYYIGDEIHLKIRDPQVGDYWHKGYIKDMWLDKQTLVLEDRILKLEDIIAVRRYDNRGWSTGLARQTLFAALGWTGYNLVAAAFTSWSLTPSTWIIAGTAFLTGRLLKWIFRRRTYKVPKRWRLRLLDLTFYPTEPRA